MSFRHLDYLGGDRGSQNGAIRVGVFFKSEKMEKKNEFGSNLG